MTTRLPPTAYVREDWYGSWYELAIELVPAGDDRRLSAAMAALWRGAGLGGPWPDRAAGPQGAPVDLRRPLPFEALRDLYGVLRLPGRRPLGCLTCIVREEHPGGADWLDLCVPTGMLAHAFPVVHPLTREDNPWLAELDRAFMPIAAAVYRATGFALALVGEEASGWVTARELTPERLPPEGGYFLPANLAIRLGLHARATTVLPGDLYWFAPRPVQHSGA